MTKMYAVSHTIKKIVKIIVTIAGLLLKMWFHVCYEPIAARAVLVGQPPEALSS